MSPGGQKKSNLLPNSDAGYRFTKIIQQEGLADHVIDRRERVLRRLKHFRVGSDHDNGPVRISCLDRGRQFIALHHWHGKIGNHNVEGMLFEQRERFFSSVRSLNFVSIEREHHLNGITDKWLIVDDQNSLARSDGRAHGLDEYYSPRS